jgi:hypothetical protein
MTDFRALCAELLAALEVQLDELRFSSELCRRAEVALARPEPVKIPKPIRPDCFEFAMDFLGDPEEAELRNYIEALEAALAQPEPQEPTDEELTWLWNHLRTSRRQLMAWRGEDCLDDTDYQQFARSVLRQWGRPAIKPVPVTDEDLYQFWESHPELGLFCDEPVKFARAVLAQWGRPGTIGRENLND